MSYLEDLWHRLFGKDITVVEESVLSGLAKEVDRDVPIMMLAALVVRSLFLILIEHKASPFRILRNFGNAMEENRRATVLITKTYAELQGEMDGFRADLRTAREALGEARQLAQIKVGYHPTLGYIPNEPSENAPVSWRAVMLVCIASSLSAFFGMTICLMIFFG